MVLIRLLVVLVVALVLVPLAFADSPKTITSSQCFQDAQGNCLANGALTLDLSQPARVASGGGQVVPLRVSVTLTAAGLIPANTLLWADDQLTPTGTTYRIRVYNSNGLLVSDIGTVIIQGTSPIDLALITPISFNPTLSTTAAGNPWVDVGTYGAKCDGTTDDSTALQNALNAAVNNNLILRLPPLTCAFGTGLTTTKSVDIEGALEASSGATAAPPISTLKYTGTGTALNINNGTTVIYNVHLKRFNVLATAASSQGTGIACTYCNTLVMRDLMVGSSNNPGFTNAYDLSNSALISAINVGAFNTTNGFRLIATTNADIDDCNLFQHAVGFLFGTPSAGGLANSNIQVHHCMNIERADRVVVWDDTSPSTTSNIALNVVFTGNYFLFDSNSQTHNQVLYMNNTSTNKMLVNDLVFRDNAVYCATAITCGPYAFNITVSGSTDTNTRVTALVEGNYIFNLQTGGITANSNRANVVWLNNQNYQSDGVTFNTDTNGAGNFAVMNWRSGIFSIPIIGNTTSTFANLGSVSAAGVAKYCTDCTTAATCAGSGSGHMAVSNGTAWTCQ